ncbi:recombinase family protein [Arachnia propionica]|uniref:Recombinase family protein n=1 Tax=Arachnia propionica TaxID=1750 RepID=A0A3P1WYM2_9ACTN|nr:recombinase family protein [Arachnia propionica]RRD50510.1 recombinase family protein [Arachnia propionica]
MNGARKMLWPPAIAREFVGPGVSAQSIAKRPVFKELLRYVEDNPQIGYVVIYMRSRAFRNFTDAAIAKRVLATMGVKLVSAKEEFGEGYMGDAMEAITDIMNEVQVRQNGEDISNKMRHKAQNGGTTGRAKLGYLNVRKDFDGRLVNTVDVDPVRAPLIRWAFEQYATGEYSLAALTSELERQGLTTRRTAKWVERPLSRSQLALILRDPYYIGKVTFKGEVFPGRHVPLVSAELFERVQQVLDVRRRRTHRDQRHCHFLRGLMQCGRCRSAGRESQLVYSQPVNHAGQAYEYYSCINRMDAGCGLPHLRVRDVEDALVREVALLRLAPGLATRLRQEVTGSLEARQAVEREARQRLRKELARLGAREERLLDLAFDAELGTTQLRKRLREVQVRRAVVVQRLEVSDEQLRRESEGVVAYLDLLGEPERFYAAAVPAVRRKLLGAFFSGIWLDDDGETTSVLVEEQDVVARIRGGCEKGAGRVPDAFCVAPSGQDQKVDCSNESNVVAGTGFEPVASGSAPWIWQHDELEPGWAAPAPCRHGHTIQPQTDTTVLADTSGPVGHVLAS